MDEREKEKLRAQDDGEEFSAAGGGRRWVLGGLIALLLVSLLSFFVWRRVAQKPAEVAAEKPAVAETGKVKFLMEQQWLIHLKLAKAEEQTVARQITATGRVIPAANSQALVAPPVSGILAGNNLPRVGQFVGAGQIIATVQQTATSAEVAQVRAAAAQVRAADAQTRAQIQAQNLQIQAQNAQAQIENARLEADKRTTAGEVEKARIRLEQAKREAARARRLFEGKALAQKQMQAAESEQNDAQANYDAAVKRRDALASARPIAPLQPLKESYGYAAGGERLNVNANYTVRAPFGGYVTKVNKSTGEQVAPGEAIIEISNLDTVWVEAPIFERDLSLLGASRTATFTVAAYPEEFKGTVLDLGAKIDEQTRAANVIFQVPNGGRALRLGMQANVRLDGEKTVTAMMIPKEAVLEAEGKKLIYVLLSGEEFERREVTLGDEYGDKVAVLSGLEKGERVVTQGAYQVRLQELRPAEAGVHSHET